MIRARRLLRRGQALAALQELAMLEPRKAGGKVDVVLLGEIELCIAQCDRVLGRNEEAEAHLAHALEVTTAQSGAPARIALARERELSGDWRGALGDLMQVAALDARSKAGTDALYLAAFVALQHHDMETARGLFGRLLPGRRWQHADEARWWLGWIDYQTGAYEQALEDWKSLLGGEGPGGVQARFWAARAEEKLGRVAEAERLRTELLKISPAGYYALLLRAGALPASPQEARDCAPELPEPDAAWLQKLRRAELLWALGHVDYAAEEMHALVDHGSPERVLLVSDVLAQLGDPGWAFALALDHPSPCGASPLSPTLFPRPYADEVKQAALAANVDPLLLWAVMRQESHFRKRARSAAQAFGPMQLLQSTSARIAAITGTVAGPPDNPSTALLTAAWYLRALMDRFGDDPALLAAAYNAGPDALARWLATDGQLPLRALRRRHSLQRDAALREDSARQLRRLSNALRRGRRPAHRSQAPGAGPGGARGQGRGRELLSGMLLAFVALSTALGGAAPVCPSPAEELIAQGACEPGPEGPTERQLVAAVLKAYPRLGKCAPCFDARLARVASVLAGAPGSGLGGTSGLQKAMLTAGVGDVAPSGFLAEGKLDPVCQQISQSLSEGHDDNVFGVGFAPRGGGIRAVVVRARRQVAVEPLPASVPVGGAVNISGRFLSPLTSPALYVESPDGKVEQIALKERGGAFEARVGFHAMGFYTLEIMGKGEKGPEVAWMLGLPVGAPSSFSSPRDFEAGGGKGPDDENAVLETLNRLRLKGGVPALAVDARLSRIAAAYAAELRELHLFAHVSPRSGDLKARLRQAGYAYDRAGENLAQGPTALEAADLAAQSPAHRKNLLDPGYSRCGVGLSRGEDDVILVELFAAQ